MTSSTRMWAVGRKAAVAVTAVILAVGITAVIVSSRDARSTLAASTSSSSATDIARPSSHSVPTMSLVEMMKTKSFRDIPMLSESAAKRAIACPRNRKCTFQGTSGTKSKSEVEQFNPTQEKEHARTDSQASMDITFDVFESSTVGCVQGHTAYQLNVTKIRSSGIAVHEASSDQADQDHPATSPDDHAALQVMQIHPFVFIQEEKTGRYIDYVVPGKELPEVATMKRSLAESLNPIIGISNEDEAMKLEDGAMLFQLRQKGMNGVRNTAYRLWHDPNEPGSHHVEHFAQLFDPANGEDSGARPADGEEADEDTTGDSEPENCPYATPPADAATDGSHHGRVKVVDDALADTSEEGDMVMGQQANQPEDQAPNEHAAEDEKKTHQLPVRAQVSVTGTFEVGRVAENPFPSQCPAALADSAQGSQRATPTSMSLAQWQEKIPTPEAAPAVELDDDAERSLGLVRRSFTSLALRRDDNENYSLDKGVEGQVRNIISVASANAEDLLDNPHVTSALRQGCDHGAVRRGVLAYLGDDTAKSDDKDAVALHFLGACGASIEKKGTQTDVVDLAANSEVEDLPREQALWALVQVSCPFHSTMDKVHKLSRSDDGIGKISLLILGAFVKNSRECTAEAEAGHHAKLDAFQTEMNDVFHAALKERRHTDVENALYAMSNSGGEQHIVAIQEAMAEHSAVLRSVSIQTAALYAMDRIGDSLSTQGKEATAAHQALMSALSVPLAAGDSDIPQAAQVELEETASEATTTELWSVKRSCRSVGRGNLICTGKRLPENSVISGAMNAYLGAGQGIDSTYKCINYFETDASLNVAVRTNIAGWNFLNPLSLDFVSLKTQFFLDRDRTPVGGYLKVFGYVVLSLASRNGGKGLFHHPNSHGRPNILGHGEGYYRPAGQRFGACHIHSQNFEGLSKSYEKWKDIVQPNCIKKYGHECSIGVGPLHIRIDGWLVGVSHNRFGVGLHSKGDWDAPRQCKSGVMTAASASDVAVRLEMSASAEIGPVKGELYATLRIISISYEATGEQVKYSYGKGARLWFKAISGRVAARLWIWRPHCWWNSRWWGGYPECNFGWHVDFDHTLWRFDHFIHFHHNFLCSSGNYVGCQSFRNPTNNNYQCLESASQARYYGHYTLKAKQPSALGDASKTSQLHISSPGHGTQKLDVPEDSRAKDTSCYMEAGAYRGVAAVAADGQTCLPWPKGSALRYKGTGLMKDPDGCSELPMGSTCYESCLYHQETNNFCRNPTDAAVPYCRTGGTDQEPTFSDCSQLKKCTESELGCTHSVPDGSDYSGDVAFTVHGNDCEMWTKFPDWKEQAEKGYWLNSCRNPNGKSSPWCFARGSGAIEFCDVGALCTGGDGAGASGTQAGGAGASEAEPAAIQH